jgi:O-antigen biosynthesis protein
MSDIKCDIIIPVWNEYALTKKCLESISENTEIPYRLILIDNASSGETACYLEKISTDNNKVVLIKNKENLGFPKAVNQGILLSKSPYLCVLNNDTEVYKGWLSEMIKVAESDAGIGIVNPASNNTGHPKPLNAFSGEHIEISACIGFCMLIKREVIEKVGNFDEIFSPGNFEDTDFSRRAVKAGYKCVIAKGAYVYHVQNTGFKKIKDRDARFENNLDIFNKRWGEIKRVAYIVKNANKDKIGALEKSIRNWLNGGHWVYVFIRTGSLKPDIGNHGSLRVIEIRRFMFDLKVSWKIFTRKKKFDEVFKCYGKT